jgi:hypothetical protein
VESNSLAKSFWNTNALDNTWLANLAFGHENWSLWIAGKKMSQIDKKKLYQHTFAKRTQRYWYRKHSLTPELIFLSIGMPVEMHCVGCHLGKSAG